MTSMTGTDGHPEVAEISALTEGVLSPARTADVREHLAACELCEDVRSSLDEIRGALGTLPGPPRMPSDIAGRIDAALAAEALLDSTTPPFGVPVSRAAASRGATPEPPADGPVPVSRETGTGGKREKGEQGTGAPVSRETVGRPHGRPHASTGPGMPAPPSRKPRRSRARRWPTVLLSSACVAAVLGVGGLFLRSGGTDAPTAPPSKDRPSSASASRLGSGELSARVHELLRPLSFSPTEPRGKTAGAGGDAPNRTLSASGGTAPFCVRQGIGRPEQALASEPDTYQGEDAYLVVLPHPGDTALVDAYVVSATCVDAGSATPGKVLLTKTLSRL
ncbi:zf-HC2 domain-containing protein [Streptomyces rectiverticillatus]|uniref:zf-HC2 domain-containing protein n=1 Tax=Streptomyces rectiverticillatus TaxID=173860 RepID=UPI0015C3FB71|nr:zf-HC2 domain-containing protein [Streptomyces rectiverticillatus]QLE73004.1 zf-HC2 domain-containing protein [Streptomyces rectiverticillatus]